MSYKKIEEFKNKVICGDALEVLKQIPDESINCVVSSPPYFNLRDYGIDGQIGLEKTYQEFIKKLVDVFDEVKRVLKKDGTCFVNLGDSYNSTPIGRQVDPKRKSSSGNFSYDFKKNVIKNLPIKSLMMIPERFAIEMIDRGWVLRNKLVWIKKNAMPEGVQDRWKKAHEYIFFFTKNKKYYFNLDKIRTSHKLININRAKYEQDRNALGQNLSSIGKKQEDKSAEYGMPARQVKLNPKGAVPPDFLDVYTNCAEFSKNHYATYPLELIAPLIRAGCPEKGIVLDPFAGVSTTGLMAQRLGCDYICIDLNPEYVEEGKERLRQKNLF